MRSTERATAKEPLDKHRLRQPLSFHMGNGGTTMVRSLIIAATIVGSLGLAACNTVRGAAADVNSVANCTENAIKSGYCK